MDDQKHWLVYSREHNCWWGPNACGYRSRIEDAGRYTLEEATKHCQSRSKSKFEEDGHPEFMMLSPEYSDWLMVNFP